MTGVRRVAGPLLCAWVAWMEVGDVGDKSWEAVYAFDTRQECQVNVDRMKAVEQRALKELEAKGTPSTRGLGELKCLPDTIDPRGRK